MKSLVFIACLMSAPTECVETEVIAPPDMPLSMCMRSAPTIMAQWIAKRGEGRFIARWWCEVGRRGA